MPLLHGELTGQIVAGFYQVHYEMGSGWPEAVYAGAMECILTEMGLDVRREIPLPVYFHGKVIGTFRADTVVNSTVILEFKSAVRAVEIAEAQLLNYLRCTDMEVGLFLKFFEKPTFKRLFLTNDRKTSRRIPSAPSYSVSKAPESPEETI